MSYSVLELKNDPLVKTLNIRGNLKKHFIGGSVEEVYVSGDTEWYIGKGEPLPNKIHCSGKFTVKVVKKPQLTQKTPLEKLQDTIDFLSLSKKKVLFLTTSIRYPFNTAYDNGGHKPEAPKSTILADYIRKNIPNESVHIDVPTLMIHPCEGNVSHAEGNTCGVKDALLKDKSKNPTGYHRCWASVNKKDDELWKISKEIFDCDIILFFGSVRWGQANGEYQKLIERLTWIENRKSSLGESDVLKGKMAGFISLGQNWNGYNVVDVQKQVLEFFGFDMPGELSWNWQYTKDALDETQKSYKNASSKFHSDFDIPENWSVVSQG